MNELIIELSEISPRDFFGHQNINIEKLKELFPKLKIVARGNKIKAYGDQEVLEEFDKRLAMLLDHFSKYNKLDENVIERVLLSRSKDDYETPVSSNAISGTRSRRKEDQSSDCQPTKISSINEDQ